MNQINYDVEFTTKQSVQLVVIANDQVYASLVATRRGILCEGSLDSFQQTVRNDLYIHICPRRTRTTEESYLVPLSVDGLLCFFPS